MYLNVCSTCIFMYMYITRVYKCMCTYECMACTCTYTFYMPCIYLYGTCMKYRHVHVHQKTRKFLGILLYE